MIQAMTSMLAISISKSKWFGARPRVRSPAWKFIESLPRQRAGPAARGETNATDCDRPYAAFFCSICLLSFEGPLPAIWMRRGFIASGISRTSSIFSSPFSKLAPFTCM